MEELQKLQFQDTFLQEFDPMITEKTTKKASLNRRKSVNKSQKITADDINQLLSDPTGGNMDSNIGKRVCYAPSYDLR